MSVWVDIGREQARSGLAEGTLRRVQEPHTELAAAPPEPGERHLGGGAIAATAAQVAVVALGAVTSVVVARALGPSGTGAFALAANLFGVALLIAGVGIKQGITVLVGSGRWSPAVAVRDLVLPLALSGIGGALLGLGAWALGRDGFLDGIPSAAVPVLVAAIPFGIAWQWSWSIALGRERYEAYA